MSTTSDYVGRTYDLVAWQGADDPLPPGRVVALRPTLADPGEGGTIIAGPQKMAQRATLILLTEAASLKYATGVGTLFMTEARLGRWRTTLDVQQAFYSALVDVKRQMAKLSRAADPADEVLADGTLLSVNLSGDRVSIGIRWVSQAGDARSLLTPIATIVK